MLAEAALLELLGAATGVGLSYPLFENLVSHALRDAMNFPPIAIRGIVETLISSIGAVLGARLTMHASVWQSSPEIGVLRALGFGQLQISFSFVVESAALGFGGALVGAAVSLLTTLIDFRCMNFATG